MFKPFRELLIIVVLLLWLGYLSRKEEYKADTFAVAEAGVPVESFVQCFSKAKIVQSQEASLETRLTRLMKPLFKLILNTHPSIEQRISRVRTLYEKKDR